MKIKKKIVIPVIAVIVIGGAAAFFVPKIVSASGEKPTTVSTTPLEKMDIENTVSVTGMVKSKNATNVYSTLSYQVKLVNVEVGDKVNEGDVLCEIDTSDIVSKIDQQTATLSQSQAKAQHNLAIAQNDLATENYNQDNNFDSAIANAEKAVEKAKQDLETAQLDLRAKELSLSSDRKIMVEDRDKNGEEDPTLRAKVQQDEIAVFKAENTLAAAKQGVEDAQASLKTAKITNQETVIKKEQQVTTARLNANFTDQQMQINELKKELDDAIVTAPVSGTITAVLAIEGGSGQGLLFVIENTDNLKIDTKIKEYDIAAVEAGQKVKIKSDATGDDEFTGKVSKIAPTAVKDAKGEILDTTDVQFITEIDVVGASGLKIGMNARLEIVTDERTGVFAVPYDAVVQNDMGEQIVYVARPQFAAGDENGARVINRDGANGENSEQEPQDGTQDGAAQAGPIQGDQPQGGMVFKSGGGDQSMDISFTAVAIPVQTGLETDFYIEILSDSLREGDLIISDPSGLTDGMTVSLEMSAGAMRPGGGQAGAGGRGGPGGNMVVRMG